ncbi:hypothetical protein TNCV_1787621 [Trichonephila clavipes]|nr:hypothetical protein TNCV_1787621 [Trichonephila clavipes]
MLGQRIAARPRPLATVRDLEIALLEEWNSIPQSLIDNLIASMANSPSIGNQGSRVLRALYVLLANDDLSSLRALGAENLHVPLALEDRNL